MADATICYLSLGSNLGDRAGNLADALRRLRAHSQLQILKVSSLYQTAPLGPPAQPDFYNIVAQFQADCPPEELLEIVQQVEQEMERVRGEHWGPRNIDIDILLFGDKNVDTPQLQLPHPQMMHRQFVLVPLAEIAPDLLLPDGRPIAQAANPDASGLRRVCRFPSTS